MSYIKCSRQFSRSVLITASMTMIVQLIVFTCACALGASDQVLPYGEDIPNIRKAYKIIRDNILSMDGNIPLLNDSRRHYAEIIHVIHYEAQREAGLESYFADYQKNVNKSLQYALVSPQGVVDETKRVLADISDSVNKVIELIEAVGELDDLAETSVEFEDNIGPVESYGDEWSLYLAVCVLAEQLNQDHQDYFAPISQNLSTHNFVITGAEKLAYIVFTLKNVYQTIYDQKRPRV